MHHFVTEMCTFVHFSATKWCIVGIFLVHYGISEVGLLLRWHRSNRCPNVSEVNPNHMGEIGEVVRMHTVRVLVFFVAVWYHWYYQRYHTATKSPKHEQYAYFVGYTFVARSEMEIPIFLKRSSYRQRSEFPAPGVHRRALFGLQHHSTVLHSKQITT